MADSPSPAAAEVLSALATCEALPSKAKRSLIGVLSAPAGSRLSASWYDFQRGSNFDKYPREEIQKAAENAQFIEYSGGHPWVTQAGHEWAIAQLSGPERERLANLKA